VRTVTLPQVDAAVAQVKKHLSEGYRKIAVVGAPSSGRSTVLQRLQKERAPGERVVTVSLPQGDDDAAAVGVMQIAAQLADAEPSLLDAVKDLDRSLADKLALALRTLEKNDALILLDEPRLTLEEGDVPTSPFHRRAYDLTAALLSAKGVRCVLAADPSDTVAGTQTVRLLLGSLSADVLAEKGWNGLAASATALRSAGGSRLDGWSPLELRLGVALISRGARPDDVAAGLRGRLLGRRLLETLRSSPALYDLLEKLALVRLPFGEDLLARLRPSDLPSGDEKLLRDALLFEVDGRLVLHEILARQLRRQSNVSGPLSPKTTAAYSELGAYYKDRFALRLAELDPSAALRDEMEAVHHYTQACNDDGLKLVTLYFVDQLDALGKALSVAGRRLDAVTCYERALSHDKDDAYAHHYKAYNLDFEAQRVPEVEGHYRQAIAIDATGEQRHVWHHGRYICFLITRGREQEARRAWLDAVAAMSLPTGEYAVRGVHSELHKPVARLALHRGLLDFAADVLDDVTEREVSGEDWFVALTRHLAGLREAARNEVVFPPDLDVDERWTEPHLVAQLPSGASWMPGRIDRFSEMQVHIRIAKREGSSIRFGWLDLTLADFRHEAAYPKDLAVSAGTFVEVLELETGRRIFMHGRAREHVRLPPIQPPPDRYMRRGATGP
jgi:tetratricopeptide (TPR) repeat protein